MSLFPLPMMWDFNSHTREGVTYMSLFPLPMMWDFNSHTREGVTALQNNFMQLDEVFQLTHP